MAVVSKTQLVPYSAEQMFDLVDDVEHYQDFLPWCSSSEVVEDCYYEDRDSEMVASLEVKKGKVKRSFTTRNQRKRAEYIKLDLVDGPFSKLQGSWRFLGLDEHACEVSLHLEYEYSSKVVKAVFGLVFNHVSNTLVKAFVKRAGDVYG